MTKTSIKVKRGFLSSCLIIGMVCVPLLSFAQLDWSVVVTQTEGTTLSGLAAAEFDGVAVSPDGLRIYQFDSQNTYDALNLKTGGVLSTFATEAEIDNGDPSPNASYTDMVVDNAGNLYTLFFDATNTRLRVIPAGQPWASHVEMTTIGAVNQTSDMAVDEANSRLLIALTSVFGAPSEDILTVPLNANGATPTILVTQAVLQAAADLVPPSNNIDCVDLVVQSDGDIIFSHGFSSAQEDSGTLIKITPDGLTATIFATPTQLIAAAGGNDAQDNIGQVQLEVLSNDSILAHVYFVGGTNVNVTAPYILLGTPDGSSWQVLATQATVLADPDMAGFTDIGDLDNKNGAVDASDNYYWAQQTPNGVIKMTGISAFLPPSSVENWSLY